MDFELKPRQHHESHFAAGVTFELDRQHLERLAGQTGSAKMKFVLVNQRIFLAPVTIKHGGEKRNVYHNDILNNASDQMDTSRDTSLKLEDAGHALYRKSENKPSKLLFFGESTAYGRGTDEQRRSTIKIAKSILGGDIEVVPGV